MANEHMRGTKVLSPQSVSFGILTLSQWFLRNEILRKTFDLPPLQMPKGILMGKPAPGRKR